MRLRKVVIIILMILLSINLNACKKYKAELQTYTIDQAEEENIEGINDILIDAHYLDINLVKTEGDKVKYNLYGKVELKGKNLNKENNNYIKIKSYSSKDKLFLKFNKDNSFQEYNNRNSLTLDIYIPTEYLNDISIISSSSNLKISNLNLNKLEIKCNSSNIEIENSNLKEFEGIFDAAVFSAKKLDAKKSFIEMTEGRVDFKEYVGNIEIYSKEAEVDIEYIEFKNNIDIRNEKGSVNIALPESSIFALDARTNEGYVRCEFPIPKNEISSDKGLKGVLRSDEYSIFVKNSKGNIRIKKLAE
ncbi:hypothetical protein SH2C18_51870 [Clostridium sediminicola]|uniref:DUF4097 family beta strand repeat-containing protein n=1 Tax=Clostridium sediminicola TaxID=3114879 RepID=UPI0031F26ACE